MHVCLLTAGRYPPDGRVRRHADALRLAGHAVTVCARGVDDSAHELHHGIDVERVADDSLYSGPRGLLDGARYALRFVHPAWTRAASAVDDEEDVDIVCVFDLSLLKTGLALGEQLEVPVVSDLPGATAAVAATPSRGGQLRGLARRVFHPAWRRRRLLKRLPETDWLVTTCEEARAEYVREKDVDPRRVAVARDTVAPYEVDPATRAEVRDELGFDENAFVVTAVADDSPKEDLETLVEAAARAADDAVSLRVVVVGDPGEETLDDLETRARRGLAGGRVRFRTEDDPTKYVAASDACVFASEPTGPETAVPGVLYEAMAAGVPVVAPETPPVRRVLDETGAGRVVEDTPRSLADALVALDDPETRAERGTNGRHAARTSYDPARDAARLRRGYEWVRVRPESGPASRFVSAITYEPTS